MTQSFGQGPKGLGQRFRGLRMTLSLLLPPPPKKKRGGGGLEDAIRSLSVPSINIYVIRLGKFDVFKMSNIDGVD